MMNDLQFCGIAGFSHANVFCREG